MRPTAVIATLLLSWALAAPAGARAYLSGDRIVIQGAPNTPATVARDIRNKQLFEYEPALGTIVCGRNLDIGGELTVGGEHESEGLFEYDNVFEMDVAKCGQARIDVRRGGVLRLISTKLVAIHDEKAQDNCSEANVLAVAGQLLLRDSAISAGLDGQYTGGAHLDLLHSRLAYTRSSGLALSGLRGAEVNIVDTNSVDNALYGLSVGDIAGPLRLVRAVLRGLAADVFNRGRAAVSLEDCDYKTIEFGGPAGSVATRWRVTVKAGQPGLKVVAQSEPGAGRPERVEGVTGKGGACELLLTEYVALPPDLVTRQDGRNNATPHEIAVYAPDGALLHKLTNYHVFMPDQEVRFE